MAPKILVADDEEGVLELLVAALVEDQDPTQILLARDGAEALETAKREKPDLIFLDVMMPKRSGLEVCRELKRDPELAPIIVVMLSALVQDSDIQNAFDAGADEYVVKPFSPADLRRVIDDALAHKR